MQVSFRHWNWSAEVGNINTVFRSKLHVVVRLPDDTEKARKFVDGHNPSSHGHNVFDCAGRDGNSWSNGHGGAGGGRSL